ncbi:MAG TPA: YbdK family carboxylate-amine ligase [Solirubrobacterales bacterium]|nr:YbdK family carboxylate-amine ligase [Solirubrobacterales bacterium]HMX71417.1 YbdK family carboxylate-amine ligase [Solirubrobacterales bacterium]HNA44469.1 YbdK family carboxylate-amine ligase [Solirubrobacterales bacterium]HNC92591.1 YbdK family carboxylate-amine ligase [Solirubrobacterales bacterium]HNE78382.1 YbdK family carboxylate-amine ligase [Solirubrobacterales bacterium]
MSDHGLLEMDAVREVFENSIDFTIGLEEEFAIVDPDSLELVDRYPDLYAAAQDDPVLAGSAAGELIASEIEIRSGRSETMSEATKRQEEKRRHLFRLAEAHSVALASLGTHPWADYLDQEIIDTPHYQRLKKDLGWVARRNNTWSLHVHVGIRGADRAVAICDWLRERLPILLAASANSIFLDRQDTGLASVRTEIFTRTFPRCGIPGTFRDWTEYARFIDDLKAFGSVVEATQLWWSVRPHHAFGTVEVRICDAQTTAAESTGMAGLMTAVVAQTAIDLDEGRLDGEEPLRGRQIEENLWRAIRYGMDGKMIDFRGRREIETRQLLEEVIEWTGPARHKLGIEVELPDLNGAQRMRLDLESGKPIEEIYRETVAETAHSYAGP